MSNPIKKTSGIKFANGTDAPLASSLAPLTNPAYRSRLRTELKDSYYVRLEDDLGDNLKPYWDGDCWMFRLTCLTPEFQDNSYLLKMLCNKSTIMYWETSTLEDERFGFHTRKGFASIYKCWFRFHDFRPDIRFGNFFAQPFRIGRAGPQILSHNLEAHANLCNHVALQLKLDPGTGGVTHSQHYHLRPLCRAIVTLLDRSSLPPQYDKDGLELSTVSLDNEVKRYTVLLVLTGDQQGLSEPITFDTINLESLPLKRHDISGIDSVNIIRVSMKIAVHFVAELERREQSALEIVDELDYVVVNNRSRRNECNWSGIEDATSLKRDGVLSAFKDADEYADAVLDRPDESEWKYWQLMGAIISSGHGRSLAHEMELT